ncbi:MAG: tetraacyldisaccharide 4'-kinase [Gammaproteobacteria bacterium]|nr:tetraacyldisaccharide 4'-kinase [Gammaproteobacteria bacterium]
MSRRATLAEGLHAALLRVWYGDGRGHWLLPLALGFRAASALRRGLYRAGLLRTWRAPVPVIVVGNISVGGTGKTPLTLWLAAALGDRGHRVGIVSRGFGGSRRDVHRVGTDADAARSGDEAVLMARRDVAPVVAGRSRRAAIALLGNTVDVVICDDGLQHLALARDVEIAVVDGARGIGNGRLLPAGPLREGPWRLDAVDAVVVNGPGFERPGALRMRLEAGDAVSLAGDARRPLASFRGVPLRAVAGIGHPQRFFALLRAAGLEPRERALPDHADWQQAGLEADGVPVLMTEKDAVKSHGRRPVDAWYVPVEAVFEAADGEMLLNHIERGLRRHRA